MQCHRAKFEAEVTEWYTILTSIFNTIVTTLFSNLDNSKKLSSFQFHRTTTLVWAAAWTEVSGKARVGEKKSALVEMAFHLKGRNIFWDI